MTDFNPQTVEIVEHGFESKAYGKAIFRHAPEVCTSDFQLREQSFDRETMHVRDMFALNMMEADDKLRKWQEAVQEKY